MSKPPTDSPDEDSRDAPPAAVTRAEVLIEAMIADRERRKPGYARRLLKLLLTPPAETSVEVLRPSATPDERVRASAIAWLREAAIRTRAAAASKRRNP